MHFSRKLILLAAFMVGLGFVGSGDVHAAALVKSVEITSPDSGSLLGIDKTFKVRVSVEDFLERSDLQVGIFLFYEHAANTETPPQTKTVLADAQAQNYEGADANFAADFASNAFNIGGGTTGSAVVGVKIAKGTARLILHDREANTNVTPNITAQAVDGDSLVLVSTSDDSTVFMWWGRVHHSSGTKAGVKAGAFVIDASDNERSALVSSKETIAIDADRTPAPANFRIVNDGFDDENPPAPISVFGSVAFPVNIDTSATKFRFIGAQETTAGVPNPNEYKDTGGFVPTVNDIGTASANSDHGVLGIGDTLKLKIQLGTGNVYRGTDDFHKVVLDIFGKERLVYQRNNVPSGSSRKGDIVTYNLVLAEGDFGDFDEGRVYDSDVATVSTTAPPDAVTDTLAFFIVDKAGNRNKPANGDGSDENAAGATGITKLLFDAKKPALDSTNGDTILPASVDTISDGSRNAGARRIGADVNQMTYKLAETLDSLNIAFEGPAKKTFSIGQTGLAINGAMGVRAGPEYTVDFTGLGMKNAVTGDSVWVSTKNQDPFLAKVDAAVDEIGVKTGMHTIKFTGTDVAGNVGPTLVRSNVYVDVDNIDFIRSFPFGSGEEESGLDTIEALTSVVVFRLSEPADSVHIEYKGIKMGADADSNDVGDSRTYALVGGQKTNTTSEQEFRVPGLNHDNQYVLQVAARDLAGNWFESVKDTFWYNTKYVVPQAAKFDVKITEPGNRAKALKGLDKTVAGAEIGIFLEARSVSNVNAPTYGGAATLTVSGGSGVQLIPGKSVGVTDNKDGTFSLNGEDWVVGKRDIVFRDTVSVETLTLSIEADDDSTLVGAADSVLVTTHAAYDRILVSAPDTVTQGANFMVNVTFADKFNNKRLDHNGFAAVSASGIGVQIPSDAVQVTKGAASFMANSSGWSGDLTLTLRDLVGTGADNKAGTATVHVRGPGSTPDAAPDAPDTLVAEDYRGALGEGDQGGFVMLTWDLSDDHDFLYKYRIYRQVMVTTVTDEETGNLVTLETPTTALVNWGTVDAIPGVREMRAVVATIDDDVTPFGVAAERRIGGAKQAFGAGQNVSNPYELMAQTMSRSREAAVPVSDAPVFASLSPEALAYQAKGVAPLFKRVDNDVLRSAITESEAIKAIDNIPPGAIPYLKVLDTPGDAGGSIRVNWTLSPDDRMLTSSVGNAVGATIYESPGVEQYNVYRKIGDGEFDLVGQAPASQTSFDDDTVFNGVRYTYQVRPADKDNETPSEFEGTAMAIRNRVLDAGGELVLGLFGSDNTVGFDDFFILAEQYGLTAEDENFEPAFDLSPNNKIDMDDFFTFADFFGRTVEGAGKALPVSMAGLNSDARFYLDAGSSLPRVGEEMAILVSLQDFVELKGYGLSVSYDPLDLAYVGARVENGILGSGEFADGLLVSNKDGFLSLGAYGDVATEGDLGLSLVFRSLREIEDSYIDIVDAGVVDGSYGLNALATPVSVRIQTRPEVYALRNNYPNPFNPETTLKYDLPEAGDVKLEVYNMLGQVVRTLVNEHKTAGRYAVQWDATNDHGQSMSSGIYFYRVQVGDSFTDVKKMLLLK